MDELTDAQFNIAVRLLFDSEHRYDHLTLPELRAMIESELQRENAGND